VRIGVSCDQNQKLQSLGKASHFVFHDADPFNGQVVWERTVDVPATPVASLLQWIADRGTDIILTAEVGPLARRHLADQGVVVLVGAEGIQARRLLRAFFAGC
jgi:predicted Fe-Mo cluster-binding NifX family protein